MSERGCVHCVIFRVAIDSLSHFQHVMSVNYKLLRQKKMQRQGIMFGAWADTLGASNSHHEHSAAA